MQPYRIAPTVDRSGMRVGVASPPSPTAVIHPLGAQHRLLLAPGSATAALHQPSVSPGADTDAAVGASTSWIVQ